MKILSTKSDSKATADKLSAVPVICKGTGLMGSTQVVQGIDCFAADADLKMAVVAGGVAGGARLGHSLPLVDLVAHGYHQGGVVGVVGLRTVVVGNDN